MIYLGAVAGTATFLAIMCLVGCISGNKIGDTIYDFVDKQLKKRGI